MSNPSVVLSGGDNKKPKLTMFINEKDNDDDDDDDVDGLYSIYSDPNLKKITTTVNQWEPEFDFFIGNEYFQGSRVKKSQDISIHYNVIHLKSFNKNKKNIQFGFNLDYTNNRKRKDFAQVNILSSCRNMIFEGWLVRAGTKNNVLRYKNVDRAFCLTKHKQNTLLPSDYSTKTMFETNVYNKNVCRLMLFMMTGRGKRSKITYNDDDDDDDDDDDEGYHSSSSSSSSNSSNSNNDNNDFKHIIYGEKTNNQIVKLHYYCDKCAIDIYKLVLIFDE